MSVDVSSSVFLSVTESHAQMTIRLILSDSSKLDLPGGGVDVWWASIDAAAISERLMFAIADGERPRCCRIGSVTSRNQFSAGRPLLRCILGAYLGRRAAEIEFEYSMFGKPFLGIGSNRIDLRFNLSHSKGTIIYALTCGREVGIDLEVVRPVVNRAELARAFFTHGEAEQVASTAPDRQDEAFLRYWTMKEAFAKALGFGLALPFRSFEVVFEYEWRVRLLDALAAGVCGRKDWRLLALHPGGSCIGSLAAEGAIRDVRYFRVESLREDMFVVRLEGGSAPPRNQYSAT